ncbi:hypothetical protein MBAV_005933 [Candidatus Magnetobacterium bavaricum]|uniref:Uncharacterized protein n=1 Tax=Candidatus Magnetobacterium bavaricum TaxID=29290 RepID=A0A0F3GJ82_9BACT|nr:hypothetical protein MBAV_005933 [Candidatus Magnetobacterium bavaricum]
MVKGTSCGRGGCDFQPGGLSRGSLTPCQPPAAKKSCLTPPLAGGSEGARCGFYGRPPCLTPFMPGVANPLERQEAIAPFFLLYVYN